MSDGSFPALDKERWLQLSRLLDHGLELRDEERAVWLERLRAEDSALAEDVRVLLARHERLEREHFLEDPVDPSPAASLSGVVMGAYTLRTPLGQGGMGSVWLADRSDGRFSGQAAVKLLNASLIGQDGEARFRREASILARLRHPNIARLIDSGVSPLGQPFIVLEYVDGDRIDRYCDSRRLGIPDRIRLFLEVLDAVAHAHAKLIVHRDLKPQNVLVDSDGRARLLDFGIAKLIDPDPGERATVTRTVDSALTPEFAAPEQVTGGDITTATDIYSLGVLLCALLTGRHPAGSFPTSPAEWIRTIVDVEPRPMSELAAESFPARHVAALKGDLDNIVGHALRKRPEERYLSVEAFADDLRRHLRHEPVSARPDTLLYRANKFVVRNRLAVAGVTLASVALIVTAGVAVREGIDARNRFDQVRKMAHTFLFDFHDELDRVAGTTKAKELLVSTASEYLDNLARSAGNDRGLLLELAEAYERLAEVQGGSSSANLNQRNAGLESRMRGIEIRKRLAGADQKQDAKLVTLLFGVADNLRNLGRMDEALAMGRQAVESGEELLRGAPPDLLIPLGSAHVILGRVLQDLSRLTEAGVEFETGESLIVSGAGGKVTRQLVATRLDRADNLHALGDLAGAVSVLEQLERDGERLVAEAQPGGPLTRALRGKQVTWASLAMIYDNPLSPSLDRPERALVYRDKLRKGWEYLISVDANNASARADLAVCDSETAVTLLKIDPRAAAGLAAQGLASLEQLERTTPDDLSLVFRSARGATRMALALVADGRPAEALPPIQTSLRKHRDLLARDDNPRRRLSLVWTLTVMGRVEQALGRDGPARVALEEAIQLAGPLARNVELGCLRVSAEAYQAYGDLVTGEERCRSLRRAQDVWDTWKVGSSPWVDARRTEAAQLVATCLNPR